MARKRYSDEDVLNLLRQIDVELSNGSDVASDETPMAQPPIM